MAEWLAPFHAPTLTTEEYEAQRAKYVAKHGYTVTLPGLFDIIKIGQPAPMTEAEKYYYRKRMWWSFSRKRLTDIMEMKWNKKQRYDAILASPTPAIFQNAGSIMTCLDNAQDAMSTLACISRIAFRWAPRLLGKIFAGPAGWLLLASDILNLGMALSPYKIPAMKKKRLAQSATGPNPFTKKARVRRARKLWKWKPGKADILQALQTTDSVFGFGISLGPIIGIIQDMITGGARMVTGKKVKINRIPRGPSPWILKAQRAMKMSNVWNSVEWEARSDWDLEILMAGYLGQQAVEATQQDWNPLEVVENLDDIELIAPQPEDPLTIDVMAEAKTPVKEFTGWPHSGKQWENVNTIVEASFDATHKNLFNKIRRKQHDWKGFALAGLSSEQAMYMLANIEGADQVEEDYTAGSKIVSEFLEMGITPDPGMTFDDINKMTTYLEDAEANAWPTSWASVLNELNLRDIPLVEASTLEPVEWT